jgi:hypothetical protein
MLWPSPLSWLFGTRRPFVPFREERDTWSTHFIKGFAGLGLLSVLKGALTSPLRYIRIGVGGGGRAARTGRDRINDVSWIIVLIGIVTFLYVCISLYFLKMYWN